MRSTKGTEQIHEQKARPNSRMSAKAMTRLMSTRGTSVLLASRLESAPMGQMAEMDSHPNAEMLPSGTMATKATAHTSSTRAGRARRNFVRLPPRFSPGWGL